MSNRVEIVATKFTDKSGETYGFRAYDDYDMTYYNDGESNVMELEDKDMLQYAICRADDRLRAMIDFCREEKEGIYINNNWYDYEEIQSVLEA